MIENNRKARKKANIPVKMDDLNRLVRSFYSFKEYLDAPRSIQGQTKDDETENSVGSILTHSGLKPESIHIKKKKGGVSCNGVPLAWADWRSVNLDYLV